MTSVLPLVVLAALATLITFMLERGGRTGYGWVAGSEFVLVGIAIGPLGLDLLSSELVTAVQPAVALTVAWLGLRLGLRFRPTTLRALGARLRVACVLEPVITLLLLRGLLEVLVRKGAFELSGPTAWVIAAVGSATTKSATQWARDKLRARGGVLDVLDTLSTLDDAVLVVAAGVLTPWLAPTGPARHVAVALGATLGLGAALAVLAALLLGRGALRTDIGWVVLLGVCALCTGLATQLGLSPVACAGVAGGLVGMFSRHADALEQLTRTTERPAVQVLLFLGGAALHQGYVALILGVTVAVLRGLAKLGGGYLGSRLLHPPARRADLGAGLLGAGGVAFAVATSIAAQLSTRQGELVLASAVAMTLLGDWVGAPALRGLLVRAENIPPLAREVPS